MRIGLVLLVAFIGSLCLKGQDCDSWAKAISGFGLHVMGHDVAVDSAHNIYVVGTITQNQWADTLSYRVDFDLWENSEIWVDLDTTHPEIKEYGLHYIYIAKYDSCSNLQWVEVKPAKSRDLCNWGYRSIHISCTNEGTLYVGANVIGKFDYFDSSNTLFEMSTPDWSMTFFQLSTDGNFQWQHTFEQGELRDVEIYKNSVYLSIFAPKSIILNDSTLLPSCDQVSTPFANHLIRFRENGDLIWTQCNFVSRFSVDQRGTVHFVKDRIKYGFSYDSLFVVANGNDTVIFRQGEPKVIKIDSSGLLKDSFTLKVIYNSDEPVSFNDIEIMNEGIMAIRGFYTVVQGSDCSYSLVFVNSPVQHIFFLDSNNCLMNSFSLSEFDSGRYDIERFESTNVVYSFGDHSWGLRAFDPNQEYGIEIIFTPSCVRQFQGVDARQVGEFYFISSYLARDSTMCMAYPNCTNTQYDPIQIQHCKIMPANIADLFAGVHRWKWCESSSSIELVTACQSYEAPSGQILTESGVYEDVILNKAGCDSVITIDLTIEDEEYFERFNAYFCDSYTAPSGDVYYESAQILDTVEVVGGCDSVFDINMIKTIYSTVVIQDDIILEALQDSVDYQWINCEDNSFIPNATESIFIPEENGHYAVILDPDGCADTSDCFEVIVTSTANVPKLPVQIYPNPSDGQFSIDLRNVDQDVSIKMYSSNGTAIHESRAPGQQIANFQMELDAGIYFVEISTMDGKARSVKRLLVR